MRHNYILQQLQVMQMLPII